LNFYPHHISDFNNSTRHLTRVERSVYRDAIELYYDSESVLTLDLDRLAKRLLCSSDEEKTALNDVLGEFFEVHGDGYFHARCDEEITKYRANTSAKARAGKASAEARKLKAAERKQKSTRVKNSSTPVHNQEPITNNQEPLNINNMFERFWEAGMVKTNKKKAHPIFKKIIQSQKDPESFTDKLVFDVGERIRLGQGGFENMHPTTYLNNERWNDEIRPSSGFAVNYPVAANQLSDKTKHRTVAAQLSDTSWTN